MQTFKVWTLEVWGHGPDEHAEYECDGNCDGYTVNNRICVGQIKVSEDTDEHIIRALVEQDYLRSKKVKLDDDDDVMIFVERESDGMPLLQLERDE